MALYRPSSAPAFFFSYLTSLPLLSCTCCAPHEPKTKISHWEVMEPLVIVHRRGAPTTLDVVSAFAIIGIIFIPVGIAALLASAQVVEIAKRYDADCIPSEYADKVEFIQSDTTNKTCIRKLIVPKRMKSPIHVYYQLDDFYQNHKRYTDSRSYKQLLGAEVAYATNKCVLEASTVHGAPVVPCGIIARNLFNDSYKFSVNDKTLEVNRKNIAWEGDKDNEFGSDLYPQKFQSKSLFGGATFDNNIPLREQDDLMEWTRTAVLSTFRKFYGKIEVDLKPNDVITVEVENNYNTYSFGGKKTLVLSTTSWIGGKKHFVGVAYLSVGCLCIFLTLASLLLRVYKPRTLGDPTYLILFGDSSEAKDVNYSLSDGKAYEDV